MSKLDAFLHPIQTEDTREVVISKRFVDKDGKPVPFKIKTITGAENDALRASCTRKYRDKGVVYEDFDAELYTRKLIAACVVEPDFSDAELCRAYGTIDPLEVPGKMLLAGEYNALSRVISDTNGFGEDAVGEAKNS